MEHRPTTAVIIKKIAAEGHDQEMCMLVEKMSTDTSNDPGKNLGEKITSLIEQRYAASQTD